jgi:RNA polymerase sigma factor (sigma-70 family)
MTNNVEASVVGVPSAESRPVPPQPLEASDKVLLDRFVASRDESAFASFLRRHGPMVLGVCRRVLGHAHDAEDAFQATFLVLARQASRISRRGSPGSWLYGVAYRVSLRARRTMSRRQIHETAHVAQAPTEAVPGAEENEFRLIVDEELHRLPARFREPLVLCYLEGKSNAEAARELGCAEGTVFSRLARGRERLRKQLARRGLVLSATVIAASLAAQGAAAVVPAVLGAATLKGALAFAIGTQAALGTIGSGALVLCQATLRGWLLKQIAVVTLVAGITTAGGALIAYSVYETNFSERASAIRLDAARLQGGWNVVEQEQNGRVLTDELLLGSHMTFIFAGNQLLSRTFFPDGKQFGDDLEFALDPTRSPKTIEIRKKDERILGIYELDGDSLKICVCRKPGARPAGFKTGMGGDEILQVLKRLAAPPP